MHEGCIIYFLEKHCYFTSTDVTFHEGISFFSPSSYLSGVFVPPLGFVFALSILNSIWPIVIFEHRDVITLFSMPPLDALLRVPPINALH